MRKLVMASVATAVAFSAVPASAAVLTINAGWQDDLIIAAGQSSTNSDWTFTIADNAVLSVADRFLPGDIYTLSGDIAGVTTFFAGDAGDVQAEGPFTSPWQDASFSKIVVNLTPGTYSFSIMGGGTSGFPKSFGVRLDGAVPEPASWALMLGGFGAIGAIMRGRRKAVVSFA